MLSRLAEGGAFEGFHGDRRQVLWKVLGAGGEGGLELQDLEEDPSFRPLHPFERIGWDYDTTSHSPRDHPLSLLREELEQRGLPDAAAIRRMPNGMRVRYAGLVICRQRPGTAKGVVFMTLEDETGFVNLVLWENVFREHRLIAKTTSFLGVTGRLQSQQGVTHVVVEELWVSEVHLRPQEVRSRDFH